MLLDKRQYLGGPYNGEYLQSTVFVNRGGGLAAANSAISPASAYTLTSTVLSGYNGNILGTSPNTIYEYAIFRRATNQASYGQVPFPCSIVNGQLVCSFRATTQAVICNVSGPLLVYTEPGFYSSGYSCVPVGLKVVPLCTVPTTS